MNNAKKFFTYFQNEAALLKWSIVNELIERTAAIYTFKNAADKAEQRIKVVLLRNASSAGCPNEHCCLKNYLKLTERSMLTFLTKIFSQLQLIL